MCKETLREGDFQIVYLMQKLHRSFERPVYLIYDKSKRLTGMGLRDSSDFKIKFKIK